MIFPHLPKTAGTSFRTSATSYFGEEKIERDYGSTFKSTTPAVLQHIFRKPDYWALAREIERNDIKLLIGHFDARRYSTLFPVTSFVTILRDPIQRFYSEFNHRSTRDFDRFEGDILDFCRSGRFSNLQTRMLQGTAWPAYAAVGFTERFSESLELINRTFGICLEPTVTNTRRQAIDQPYQLSDQAHSCILAENRKDIFLYQTAMEYFDERLKLDDPSLFIRGKLEPIRNGVICGFAISTTDDSAVELDILVNDEAVCSVIANQYLKQMHLLGTRRNGHVGFRAQIPNLKSTDMVSVRVSATGQKLAYTRSPTSQ